MLLRSECCMSNHMHCSHAGAASVLSCSSMSQICTFCCRRSLLVVTICHPANVQLCYLHRDTGPTPSNALEKLAGSRDAAAAVVQAGSSQAVSMSLLHAQQLQQQQQKQLGRGAVSPEVVEAQLQPGASLELPGQLLAASGNSSSAINTTGSIDHEANSTTPLLSASPAAAAAAEPGNLPPRWFAVLPRLTQLRVMGCGVTGGLPAELSAARQLNSLVLSHNKITGLLPEQLVQLQVRLAGD
jgi:hypothetical protein